MILERGVEPRGGEWVTRPVCVCASVCVCIQRCMERDQGRIGLYRDGGVALNILIHMRIIFNAEARGHYDDWGSDFVPIRVDGTIVHVFCRSDLAMTERAGVVGL